MKSEGTAQSRGGKRGPKLKTIGQIATLQAKLCRALWARTIEPNYANALTISLRELREHILSDANGAKIAELKAKYAEAIRAVEALQ